MIKFFERDFESYTITAYMVDGEHIVSDPITPYTASRITPPSAVGMIKKPLIDELNRYYANLYDQTLFLLKDGIVIAVNPRNITLFFIHVRYEDNESAA